MSWNDSLKWQCRSENLAIFWWSFQYFMINFNIFLHLLVIQYMPDLTIGSKVFQILFEFFLPKKSLQNWQKKSIFSGAIGDHILGFWTQCKKSQLSRSSRSRKSFFWMTLHYVLDNPEMREILLWLTLFIAVRRKRKLSAASPRFCILGWGSYSSDDYLLVEAKARKRKRRKRWKRHK